MKTPLTLTPEQVAAEIERRNLAFQNASPARQRILLAKDVIDQIKIGRFAAMTGNWATLDGGSFIPSEDSVQKALLDGTVSQCNVCALGGLMVSCVLFKNKVTGNDYDYGALDFDTLHTRDNNYNAGIRRHFSASQLILIELAYEGHDGWFGSHMDSEGDVATPTQSKAMTWAEREPDDAKRLVAIMRNIVRNDGRFVP